MQTTPEQSRFFWSVMTIFTTLMLLGMVALLLTGCTTFEKARRKFSTTVVDTVYNTVQLTVPRDSAVLHLVTDTTTVVREIRQGRATISYQRDPRQTTVRAICDSIIVEKKVPQYISRQVWGIDPTWQRIAQRRLTIIWALVAALIVGLVLYIFNHRLLLSISKR